MTSSFQRRSYVLCCCIVNSLGKPLKGKVVDTWDGHCSEMVVKGKPLYYKNSDTFAVFLMLIAL